MTGDKLARWGEGVTVRVDEPRCPRCRGRMMRIVDYYSHEIKRVCRGCGKEECALSGSRR